MYWGEGADTAGRIEWKFALDGARIWDGFTPFSSTAWLGEGPDLSRQTGEVVGAPRVYSARAACDHCDGTRRAGELAWFREGVPSPIPPNLERDAEGCVHECVPGRGSFAMTGTATFAPVSLPSAFLLRQVERALSVGSSISVNWGFSTLNTSSSFVTVGAFYNLALPLPTLTPPAGYIIIHTASQPGLVHWDLFRGPAAAEVNSGLFVFSQPVFRSAILVTEWVGLVFTLPIDVEAIQSGTSTNVFSPFVTPHQPNSLAIASYSILNRQLVGFDPPIVGRVGVQDPGISTQLGSLALPNIISIQGGRAFPFSVTYVGAITILRIAGFDTNPFALWAGSSAAAFVGAGLAGASFAIAGAGSFNPGGSGPVTASAFAMTGTGGASFGGGAQAAASFAMTGSGAMAAAPPPPPAITRVQTGFTMGTPNTQNLTWSGTTTAGNLLVVVIAGSGVMVAPTITPPAGWTLAIGDVTTVGLKRQRVAIYYKENAAAESSTGNWTVTTSTGLIALGVEYSGCKTSGALDVTATATGLSTSAATGTTGTTSQAVEVCVGGLSDQAAAYSSPLNGFLIVQQQNLGGTDPAVCMLENIVAAAAAYSSGATIAASTFWRGLIATFKGL